MATDALRTCSTQRVELYTFYASHSVPGISQWMGRLWVCLTHIHIPRIEIINCSFKKELIKMLTFYDIRGKAIAYLDDDGQSIFLYNGKPVAWLSDESVYAYSGRHLGWFEDGWIRDLNGRCVFFTDDSSGGPVKPTRQVRPTRGARGARPARGVRQARPVRAVRSCSWSKFSGEAFFEQ